MTVASRYQKGKAVKIVPTGNEYDFIASIINDSNNPIKIYVDDLEGWYSEPITVKANDWIGLTADDEGKDILKCILRGDFKIR